MCKASSIRRRTNGSGTLVNPLTGAPLFGASNALAAQDGIFRTTTLTLGSQTTLDRDIFSINLLLAQQTSASGNTSSNAESKTASVNWLHQMRPDMTVSAAISYAIQDQSAAVVSTANPGNNTSDRGQFGVAVADFRYTQRQCAVFIPRTAIPGRRLRSLPEHAHRRHLKALLIAHRV